MPSSERHARVAARLAALLLLIQLASGTHFRYGSMRWWVGDDSLAGARTSAGLPVYQAVFQVKGAWRRDYSWGALFNEQWRKSSSDSWRGAPVANGDFDCSSVRSSNNPIVSGVQCFEPGKNLLQSAADYSTYQIKFITGVGFQGLDMPPTQRQCTSPLHQGALGSYSLGQYGGPGPTLGTLTNTLPDGYWGVQNGENKITSDPSDDMTTDFGVLFSATNMSEIGTCASWAESYGFFFGDGTYTDEVVVSVTDIDFDSGLVGNALRATSQLIVHNYSAPHDTSGTLPKPWVAYWTGGNRISELRNNADGRFRLEIDVRFLTYCTSGSCSIVRNKSPVVAQIPVMPVVYPTTGVAMFQVAAYDPDYDRKDQVRFFVGNPQEHGYILSNYVRYRKIEGGPIKEEQTYYKDVYHLKICETRVAVPSVCKDTTLVGPNNAVVYANYAPNVNLTADGTTLYPAWNDMVNYAHAPLGINNKTLSIGSRNGMVTWEVGTSPTAGMAPGFYQVTIMVEERWDADQYDAINPDALFTTDWTAPGADYFGGYDPVTGNDRLGRAGAFTVTSSTTRGAGPRVPVDFMMYLYPAMHYCSANCDRTSSGNIMQTFESSDGLYGDPDLDSRPGDGLAAPGTGKCKICGGGGQYTSIPGDSGMKYIDAAFDSVSYCQVINTPTTESVKSAYARGYDNRTGVAEYGLWRTVSGLMSSAAWKDYSDKCNIVSTTFNNGQSCRENPFCTDKWVFQGCLGVSWTGTSTIVPYNGIFETCQINHPPRFITDCDCGGTAWRSLTGSPAKFTPSAQNCLYNMRSTGIERTTIGNCCNNPNTPLTVDSPSTGLYTGMFYPSTIRGILGQNFFFDLVATDDDQCVELVISDTGMPSEYMKLEPHQRIGTKTVSRKFTFNPPSWVNGTAALDPRPSFSRVCFYVTDKYLITSYPYHCVSIELVPPVAAKWCDEVASDGTAAPDGLPGTITNTLEEYKVLKSYINETIELPLCVYKSETLNVQHNMVILPVTEESPGLYPNLYNFSYPVDQINFPPQWTGPTPRSIAPVTTPGWYFAATIGKDKSSKDPIWRTWTFTPDETQECVYTICFRGADIESANLESPELTPTQFTSVRCYRIEVYNSVLEFSGAGSEVIVPGLSERVTIANGFSMSVWAYPRCVNMSDSSVSANMTLIYFGSTRHFQTQQGYYGGDRGLPIRNGLKWAQTTEDMGRFYYEDCRVGIKASPAQYACEMWHFVAFTVDEEHKAVLYVDGDRQTQREPYSLHYFLSTQLKFETPSRPDTPDDITTGTGRFAAGSYNGEQPMLGALDDIYVWNRALSTEEIGTVMYSRTLFGNLEIQKGLLAWFPMRDGNGGAAMPLADYSGSEGSPLQIVNTGSTPAMVVDMPTPTVVPCVRGLEMPVGPTDGTCKQHIYGWNFAQSPFTAVRFGKIQVPAELINSTELLAETPGYVSPRFVSVTASNNARVFTNITGVGRDTQFLYLDAGLYMDGSGGGAMADSVCLDLPNRAVTFGAWVCVDCGQPTVYYGAPDPGMPNPEPKDPPEPAVDQILKPLYDMGHMKKEQVRK